MSKRKIAIIGHGYVGKAMHRFFNEHYECRVYDLKYEQVKFATDVFSEPYLLGSNEEVSTDCVNMEKSRPWNRDELNECDVAVLCLPTQPTADGSCDTSLIEAAIEWIECPLLLIKSTVAPGTTERLKAKTGKRIVFSPEYCGESKYWTEYKFHTDVKETPWFTFGGDPKDTEEMVNLFIRVVGPTKTYHQTDATTAELAKYVENTFYAMKVTFCYEIAAICEKMGVDYNKMREAWLLDPRLNKMHTAVFHDSIRPFGGKCYPKDVSALVEAAAKLGYEPALLREILASNDRIGQYRQSKISGIQ